MLINSKILSLPPFISTSWENVKSLHWDRGTDLVVTLTDGSKIVVPQLPIHILHIVFKAHSDFLENHAMAHASQQDIQRKLGEGFQFIDLIGKDSPGAMKFGDAGMVDAPFQHNPEQANFPDMPESLLEKMSSLLKTIGLDQFDSMPEAEPHCNCLFCQVSKTIHRLRDEEPEKEKNSPESVEFDEDEIVTDEDLRFKEWDIVQLDENRYQVINPLNVEESFQVFLGEPVGCTCGEPNCVHIKAVLRS